MNKIKFYSKTFSLCLGMSFLHIDHDNLDDL